MCVLRFEAKKKRRGGGEGGRERAHRVADGTVDLLGQEAWWLDDRIAGRAPLDDTWRVLPLPPK